MTTKINPQHRPHHLSGRRYAIGAIAVALGAIALAGCGSSGGTSTSNPANTSSSGAPLFGGAPAPSATSSSSGSATTPTAQTLTVKQTPGGTSYLTDTAGKTLYLFEADTGGKSACNGPCAAAWPPLTATTTAGMGVTGTPSTFTRTDGSKQAVLNGHPLYYFTMDTAAGQTNGQGINAFGGLWYVISPTGNAIKSLK